MSDGVLAGKVAVVTGSASGLGYATARRLAALGADCVLSGRNLEALEAARRTLVADGGGSRITAVACDLARPDGPERLIGEALSAFATVDVLVNNAGDVRREELPGDPAAIEAALRADLELKVLGYWRCAELAAAEMAKRGWGRIVNVAGVGYRRVDSLSVGVRNASLVYMTKWLSRQHGASGITVNAVTPGFMLTESQHERLEWRARAQGVDVSDLIGRAADDTDLGRSVSVEEVASVIAFLASPDASGLTGESIGVTAGLGQWAYY